MGERQPVMVLLSPCRHSAFFDPAPLHGDEVYCRKCEDWRMVMVTVAEWRIRCRSCHLSHRYGEDETSARRTAIKHVARFAGHTVVIFQGDRLDAEVKAAEPLPGTMPDCYHTVTLP
jgi:hypothetical protein